jgi:dolichyl-phosphate-mannose-protein mannosyltransferase
MFSLVKFHNYREEEFSDWWWVWLATTGVSIGCVCRYISTKGPLINSVKWVGIFGMAVVGLYTIDDLWQKFGDLSLPKVFVR